LWAQRFPVKTEFPRMPLAVVCPELSKSAVEGVSKVEIRDVPARPITANGVRVSVRSASINFPELLMMQGKYQYKPQPPFILCSECAGVVVEVGSKVKTLKAGDSVFCAIGTNGAACEEIVVDHRQCVPMPDTLTFSQGAGFMMGYTTGWHALVHRGKLKAGEWLLVTGAGGGMGVAAVQLGKVLGARVIAAASDDAKLEVCRKVGADFVVNYSKEKLKDAVSKITNGEFCDVIYEPVGGDVFDQCVRCVASKGYARLLVVGFAAGRIPQLPANMALIKGFDLIGVRMGAQFGIEPDLARETTAQLLELAQQGKLKPYVGAEYPLDRCKDAFTLIEQKKVVGKCCITFGGSKL